MRYFAYVQVDSYHESINPTLSSLIHERGLWKSYKNVASHEPKLQMKRVYEEKDIYPVFRELFTKKGKAK